MSDKSTATSGVKKELPIGIRVLLRILSILLCLCLFVSVTATALILDYRQVTSKDTTRQIADSLFRISTPQRHLPITAAMGGLRMAAPADADAQTLESLVAWLYDTLKTEHGDDLLVTREQMQAFLDQSTTKDYLTEKIVSYMDDFLNGTNNTTITAAELEWLIDENMTAIETELGIEIDDEARQQVLSFAKEVNIGEVIRTEVIEKVEDITFSDASTSHPSGYTVGDMMADLRTHTSNAAVIISIAINVALIAALFFCNRMRLSGTLCCVGIPLTIAGGLLSLATGVVQILPVVLPAAIASAISVLTGAIAPVHYTILGLGVAALIGAIAAKSLRKKVTFCPNS